MNERIKQLALQSQLVYETTDGKVYNSWEDYVDLTEYVEKFAELIVGECMNIAKNWQDQLENANSLSESNAVGIVAYRIARQFGVKE